MNLLGRPLIVEGEPRRRPDRDLVAGDVVRAGDRLLGVGREPDQRSLVGHTSPKQHRELVTAEPGDQTVVDRCTQPMRDLYEEGVPRSVAAGVVDSLESVEIHEDHRRRPIDLQTLTEGGLEAEPVRKSGEHVVARGDLDPAQHLDGVADVAHGEDEPLRRPAALGVERRRVPSGRRISASRRSQVPDRHLIEQVREPRVVAGLEEGGRLKADQLLRGSDPNRSVAAGLVYVIRPSLSTIMKTSRVPSTSVRKCRSLRSRSPESIALVRDISKLADQNHQDRQRADCLDEGVDRTGAAEQHDDRHGGEHGGEVDRSRRRQRPLQRHLARGSRRRLRRTARRTRPNSSRRAWSVRMPALCPTSPNVASDQRDALPGGSRLVRRVGREKAAKVCDREADDVPASARAGELRRNSASSRLVVAERRLDAQRPGKHEGGAEHDQYVDRTVRPGAARRPGMNEREQSDRSSTSSQR